jgi:hypothetical protein
MQESSVATGPPTDGARGIHSAEVPGPIVGLALRELPPERPSFCH